MKIKMKADISGTRNGEPWPPRGGTIELPDHEAAKLCKNGLAIPVTAQTTETATMPQTDVEQREQPAPDAPAAEASTAKPKAKPRRARDDARE